MNIKNLSTNEIFSVLNSIKQNIGLAVCEFTDNQVVKNKAIKNMENRFNSIVENINNYFIKKKVKNIIKISIQLNEMSDIAYWNNPRTLETLKINLAHQFDIALKCIETNIYY